jgi:HEAT repeat protein
MIQPKQSIGIFTTDIELVVRSWDSWLASVTGISADSVRGVNLMELFPELEARGLQPYFERVLTKGIIEVLSPSAYSYLIPSVPQTFSKRFKQMQQRVTIAPLRDKDRIIGTIVTIEDVTPQLDREQDLSELATQLESPNTQPGAPTANQDDDTETFLEALGNNNWQVRQTAVETLVRHGGPDAIAVLVRKMRDEHQDFGVLNSAIQALTQIEGDIITPLTELLNVPDVDLRGYAVLALGEQTDRRAILALIQALSDEDTNVRYNAIEALGKLKAIEAVDALADIAESRDFFLAFPALDALKRIGDPSVIPRLVALLEDELLREPVVEVLSQLGDETVVTPLANLLTLSDAPINAIAQAITTLYDRYEELYNEGEQIAELVRKAIFAPVQNLLNTLNNTQGEELRAVARVLSWLSESTQVDQALARLLGEPSVQKEVVTTLVRHGTRVSNLLIEQLEAEEVEIRRAAILALGRIGERRAVPTLTGILTEEENNELIIRAAEALTSLGDPRAFESLLSLLGHSNAMVRQSAVAALNSINHPNMAERAVILLRDPNPYLRESAVKIIGYIGYRDSLELLLISCHDTDERVRYAVIESLPYFEDERVIPVLTEALKNDTPKIRAAAARAFGDIDDANVIEILQTALKDTDPWVRYFAVRSLGEQEAIESLDALISVAKNDAANQVRMAAIEALGKLGDVQAVSILAPLSASENTDLAHAALEALGKIDRAEALPPLKAALNSPDPIRKHDALQALGRHHQAEAVKILQQVAATAEDIPQVQQIIDNLTQIATPEAINALVALSANPSRRDACVNALAQLDEQQTEWIANGLRHEHSGVRSATVEALARMKKPHTIKHLIIALEDKEASVRLAAITALGHLDIEGAEQKFSKIASEDPNIAVRRAAQKVL